MPYNRETAGKGGHSDFVRNPDVGKFLSACEYMKPPTDDEAKAIASLFQAAPKSELPLLPKFVVASDASKSDSPINDKLPSTQIGYIKVSHVLISMEKYDELIDPKSRFVDPFKTADLHRNAQPVTFVLPGSNIKYRGAKTVRDGFRRAVFDQFSDNRRDNGSKLIITELLLALNDNNIIIQNCPSCNKPVQNLQFTKTATVQNCPSCKDVIYITDWLRLHENISDFGNNSNAMTRLMNAVEHLLLAAFIQELLQHSPAALSKIAFVIDGPLALFGEPSKLHIRLMALIHKANFTLESLGYKPLLIMGLQKTGIVMDHARLLQKYLPNGVLKIIDDHYRNTYITGSDTFSENFGHETYYGQDFLFKTERGRVFNFALPYPFENKGGDKSKFAEEKINMMYYGDLVHRTCDLIRHFELDLYDNAIVPVALAHRHASISLIPGGKVLDLLSKTGLKNLQGV